MTSAFDGLEEALAADQISRTVADRDHRATDWGTDDDEGVRPDVVVWPESTADVAVVLRYANEHDVPVTPYAAGTSIEGNAVPIEGGISLDLLRMDDVIEIRPDDMQVDVQPGAYGADVDEAVARHGLALPALPSSMDISTIGGMIANDASGMGTVKYGEVADWVLELEVVLPTGEVMTAGSKAAKTSAGYNLKELIIGSEGTLGVVTRATLGLTGRPQQVWGGRATFGNRRAATEAVVDAVVSGVDLAKVEFIDALSVEMANAHLGTDLPVVPTLFIEFHANHGIEEEVAFCQSVFEDHRVDSFTVSETDADLKRLWAARRELADAIEPYRDDLTLLTPGDVTVPISAYPDIIDHAKRLGDEHDLLVPCFGHAGDGNVHYNVLVEADDPESRASGEIVSKAIVEQAIELGGTSTGEHGVGTGKKAYLEPEHGPAGVDAMRAVKRALDPNGILNPGKVFPDE